MAGNAAKERMFTSYIKATLFFLFQGRIVQFYLVEWRPGYNALCRDVLQYVNVSNLTMAFKPFKLNQECESKNSGATTSTCCGGKSRIPVSGQA